MDNTFLYVLAGLAAGLVSGLFGVGGGLTVVPALVLALPIAGVTTDLVMHMAIGTSLAVMIFTSAITTFWRHRSDDLDTTLLWRLTPWVAIGGLAGAAVGDALNGLTLRLVFIAFVALTIIRDARRHWLDGGAQKTARAPTPASGSTLSFAGHGIAAGVIGALLGAGAAIVVVPFVVRLGHRIQIASALSAALSALIGLAAGAGYIVAGLDQTALPPLSLGYVYLPAFAIVAAGALAGSPAGVKLSHVITPRLQRTLFIIYLCIVLSVMISRL